VIYPVNSLLLFKAIQRLVSGELPHPPIFRRQTTTTASLVRADLYTKVSVIHIGDLGFYRVAINENKQPMPALIIH